MTETTKPLGVITMNVISFDTNAKTIINAYRAFDKASGKLGTTVAREFQAFIDAWSIANDRGEASCKAMQKAIVDCDAVLNIVASGAMDRKTFVEYAQSAARALHFSVAFEPGLKNNDAYKLPWSKKGKGTIKGVKSGPVQNTDRTALDKTLSKALAQARLLGLIEFAADVLDLCLDRLDGFKETVIAK